MNKVFISLLAAAISAGCAGKPRAGGPAPVESVHAQSATSAVAPAAAAPAADVYAYRAPAKAPPPAKLPEEAGGSAGTMLALRSETPGPARAPGTNVATKAREVDPGLAPAIAWTPPPASAVAPKAPPTPVSASTSAQAQAPTPVPSKTSLAANTASVGGTPPKATAPAPSPAPVPVKPAPPPPPPPVVKYTAPPPAAPALPAAASALAAQAEQQRERGDYVAAAATLERAIRIQPLSLIHI